MLPNSQSPTTDKSSNMQRDSDRLLLVSENETVFLKLLPEAKSRSILLSWADSPEAAMQAMSRFPDVVLIDFSRSNQNRSYHLIKQISEYPHAQRQLPILVLSDRDTMADRVEIARLGASGFLQKPQLPSAIIDNVLLQLESARAHQGRVLVVEEPHTARKIRNILEHAGIQVRTENGSEDFWKTLEEYAPDLLILSAEMSFLNAFEVCQALRNDPHWEVIPVAFVSSCNCLETLNKVFAFGGDDLIERENLDEHLLPRIQNRLNRTHIYTRLAETDPLTGLANRRKSAQSIARLMLIAQRQQQPLSIALLDLDHFKNVNDSYGHAIGDMVLRRLGHLLLSSFRGEDVVARWGGEEIVIGIFGMSREDGVHRLAEVLDQFRSIKFEYSPGHTFSISFSAGVAEYPTDGLDLHSLYRVADSALYLAKGLGRNRVLPAKWQAPLERSRTCDLMVTSSDPQLIKTVEQALNVRGYSTIAKSNISEAFKLLQESYKLRAVLIDVETLDEAQTIQLEDLVLAKKYPARQIILLIPETRTIKAPLPDIPGLRFLGCSFADHELMRILRQVWRP